MSFTKHGARAGVTLIELLMVIGIILVLLVFMTRTFSTANSSKVLDTEAFHIVSELNRARSLTLSSKYAQPYGIHFATSSMTLYKGASYVVGSSTNDVILLHKLVQISSTNLSGGGPDVLFARLSGETQNSGTITLSLVSSPFTSKTVTIYSTGVSEAQ